MTTTPLPTQIIFFDADADDDDGLGWTVADAHEDSGVSARFATFAAAASFCAVEGFPYTYTLG